MSFQAIINHGKKYDVRSKTVSFLTSEIKSWMNAKNKQQLIIEVHHTKRTVGDALKVTYSQTRSVLCSLVGNPYYGAYRL